MSNSNANRLELALNSSVNMNRNKAKIVSYNRFNKKNCSIYGAGLSPYYRKEETQSNKTVYDSEGNAYTISDGYLTKNGDNVMQVNDTWQAEKTEEKIFYYDSNTGAKLVQKADKDYYMQLPDGTDQHFGFLTDAEILTTTNYGNYFFILYYKINAVTDTPTYIVCGACGYVFKIISNGVESYQMGLEYNNIALCNCPATLVSQPVGYVSYMTVTNNSFWGVSFFPQQGEKIKYEDVAVYNREIINPLSSSAVSYNCNLAYPSNWTQTTADTSIWSTKQFFFYNGEIKIYSNYDNTSTSAFTDPTYVNIASKILLSEISTSTFTMTCTAVSLRKISCDETSHPDFKVIANYTIMPYFSCQYLCVVEDGKLYTLELVDSSNYTEFPVMQFDEPPSTADGDTNIYSTRTFKSSYKNLNFFVTSGFLIGIGTSNETLLTDWNSINELFPVIVSQDSSNNPIGLVYRTLENKTIILTKTSAYIVGIFEDRFIFVSSDYYNDVYDTKTGEMYKWDSAVINDIGIYATYTSSDYMCAIEDFELFSYAAAVNPLYETTGIPIVGTALAQITGYIPNKAIAIKAEHLYYQPLDVFYSYSADSSTPIYKLSLMNVPSYPTKIYQGYNSLLEDLAYPITTTLIYSLSILDTFIKSYNNHDYVLLGDKGYPLLYQDNSVIFGYTALSFIEGISNLFVIQSMTYMIAQNKLLYVTYNGNELNSSDVIADITGLVFIGALPDSALFWSPYNKKVMSFTGNAIMTEYMDANAINTYYGAFYLPASNSVLLSVSEDDGDYVYIFQQNNMLKISCGALTGVYIDYNGNNEIILTDVNNKTTWLRFTAKDGYTSDKVILETSFFGSGNEVSSTTSCFYVRIFDDQKRAGEVKMNVNTLTNSGTQTETKTLTITSDQWDNLTNTILLQFQPQYQTGVGIQLCLESDFQVFSIILETQETSVQQTSSEFSF